MAAAHVVLCAAACRQPATCAWPFLLLHTPCSTILQFEFEALADAFLPSKIVLASQVLLMYNGLRMTWEARNAAQANLPTGAA